MKRKLLLTALLSVGAFCINAHADDVFKDVTNTYLTNADFEGNYSVYSNPSADRAIYQPSGWTVTYTNGDPNDMTSLNSNCSSWNNFSGKAQLTNGGENTYWVRMRWGTGAVLKLSQEVTLPMGKYVISAAYYKNGSGGDGYIFVGSTEINTNVNEDVWKTLSIDFESDGFAATTIGCYAKHTNAYEKFLAFDNFVLQWNLTQSLSLMISKAQDFLNDDPSNTNLGNAIADANSKVNSTDAEELESAYNSLASVISLLDSRKNWLAAKKTAQEAIDDTSYGNVTGNERTTLSEEIEKGEPTTADDYRTAIEALNNATAAFKAAKDAYDAFVSARDAEYPTLDYASAAKKTALEDACGVRVNTADEATEGIAAIKKALRAYYESHALAECVDGAVNMTESITNYNATDGNNGWTWTGTKNEPRNTESWTDSEGNNQYMYFDGGNWSGTGWTTTMEQALTLPAGRYLLTAKGRASDGVTFTMSIGEKSVELPNVNASGNVFDYGWGDGSVEFETNGDPITIQVKATTDGYHQWFSISDFRLVQLEEIEVPMADETDYAALNEAIAPYQNLKLGFDEDEYAPYNNVDAILLGEEIGNLDEQKVQNHEYTKEYIQGLTTAANNLHVVPNETEVNAIYDGVFANTEANTTTGDINLPGWTKVQGIRLLVKDEEIDPGLAYTDGKAAVFSWGGTTLTYGEQTGYTLPLNAGEVYELSFKITGWRDGDFANVLTVALDGQAQTINPNIPGKIDAAEGNPFTEVKFYLTPSEDVDNSILTIYANHHFAIADLKMFKAITIDKDVELAAGKYATRIYPFAPKVIEGITFYSCDAVNGTSLTLTPVTNPQACVPYILGNDAEGATAAIGIEQTGVDIHVNDTYESESGLLIGVFANTVITSGYVLQTQNGKQSFYKVDPTKPITVPPYRAYLNYSAEIKALGFDDATAINTLDALTSGAYEGIYSVDGVKLNRLEKGVNILKMADGTTRKVVVK